MWTPSEGEGEASVYQFFKVLTDVYMKYLTAEVNQSTLLRP